MSSALPEAGGGPALPTDLAEWVGAVKLMQLALEATDPARVASEEYRIRPDTPAFPSRMLLTLLAYAYSRGVFPSQDIEEGCRRSGDLHYLCAGDLPTALVLRRFRREHWAELHGVLARLLELAAGGRDRESWARFESAADARMARAVAADSLNLE